MFDGPFDIYLLDIVMPGMNGIELGREIRKTDWDGSILYLTSSPDFALESYQTKAASYLLKPVERQALFTALDEAVAVHSRRWENGIIVKTHSGSVRLLADDILYAELRNRCVHYCLRAPAQCLDRLLAVRRDPTVNLLDISTIWYLFHVMFLNAILYEPRLPKKKAWILTACLMGPLAAYNAWFFVRFGNELAGQMTLINCTIPSLIFFMLMARHRNGRLLFTFCLSDTVSLEIVYITRFLDDALGFPDYWVLFILRLIAWPVLEYAIHAVQNLPPEQRVIRCKCIHRPQLMFRVSNPFEGTVQFDTDGRPVAASNTHGFGTRSITAYCEKYGAYCTYKAEDGWFTIQIMQTIWTE